MIAIGEEFFLNLLFYAPLLFIFTNVAVFVISTLRPRNFPPGPRGIPGLGNLLQIDKKFPFQTYGAWFNARGQDSPVGFKAANNNLVVLNSARLVHETFDKRGAVYSDRPYLYINNEWITGNDLKFVLVENAGPWVTRWRKNLTYMLNPAALKRLTPAYEAEAARFVVKVLEAGPNAKGEGMANLLLSYILSIQCLGLCAKRPEDLGGDLANIQELRYAQQDWISMVTPGAGDVFPPLRYLPSALAPWKDKALRQRVRSEILEVTGGVPPRADHIPSLKYLEACFYEFLRWRPPAPQAAAHATPKDEIFEGYRIPKGSAVIANVWHLHHSEADYEAPNDFIPERWLRHPFGMRLDAEHDSTRLETQGRRRTYAFGAGRRMCPGMESAKKNLLLGMAKFLWAFEVLPPDGQDIDLSMETGYISDLALRPKSTDVVVKLRDGVSREDVYNHYYETYKEEAEVMGWANNQYR
ncbi:cytochrome P450 [Melanomma pulvis-pyrius CBS 109.77]|uniref:Cytochrome P450 n=1 Tax=Melanomma pulvis-pyrius CBS 109.77 TaxID=1314802 RepID=A0A6A6XEL3_9PLEO|nr:cytochrome P450 [Melanomma pulvis-pyrius CBS 109.77]